MMPSRSEQSDMIASKNFTGITYHEWLVGQALSGIDISREPSNSKIANRCHKMADEIIKGYTGEE